MESPDAPSTEHPSAQQLDQIRMILFGDFMRDIRERFARMEQSVAEQIDEVRAQMQEQHVALTQRIEAERSATATQFEEVAEQARSGSDAWEARADALQEALDKASAAAEDRLIETRDDLMRTLDTQYTDLRTDLQETQARLTDAKADRRDLASLFDQVSAQLRDDQGQTE